MTNEQIDEISNRARNCVASLDDVLALLDHMQGEWVDLGPGDVPQEGDRLSAMEKAAKEAAAEMLRQCERDSAFKTEISSLREALLKWQDEFLTACEQNCSLSLPLALRMGAAFEISQKALGKAVDGPFLRR